MARKWSSFEKFSAILAALVLIVAILAWVTTRPTHQSGNATTTGPNSPATTGDNNKTEINDGTPQPDSKTKDNKGASKASEKGKP